MGIHEARHSRAVHFCVSMLDCSKTEIKSKQKTEKLKRERETHKSTWTEGLSSMLGK